MSKYFTNLAKGCRVNRSGKPPVDLTDLPTDNTCKRLYLQGFKYIGITPEAEKILKSCPQPILERLIEQKKQEKKLDEVEILSKLLKPKKKVESKK